MMSDEDAMMDELIDFMAELGKLEIEFRTLREGIEPLANGMFYAREYEKAVEKT